MIYRIEAAEGRKPSRNTICWANDYFDWCRGIVTIPSHMSWFYADIIPVSCILSDQVLIARNKSAEPHFQSDKTEIGLLTIIRRCPQRRNSCKRYNHGYMKFRTPTFIKRSSRHKVTEIPATKSALITFSLLRFRINFYSPPSKMLRLCAAQILKMLSHYSFNYLFVYQSSCYFAINVTYWKCCKLDVDNLTCLVVIY